MPQDVTASPEDLRCPYCGQQANFENNLIVDRCEHLVMVQGHSDGADTATFKASDEFFVFDSTQPPTVGVYVKRDDPRYATAHDSGYAHPDWPPPTR